MVYNVRDIMRDVRIAIDENKISEKLILEDDIDTLALNDIIASKTVEAVRRVVSEAPLHLLGGGRWIDPEVYWGDNYSGWILLPDDFMRLLIFKMSDWERPVYEAITAADVEYQLQHSRYKGIRGNVQKPVVAIVSRSQGLVLEFYSCKDRTAKVEQALYYPMPKVDRFGGIEIPERCYTAVVYQMAALVAATVGQAEMSGQMTELSKQILI